MSEEKREFGRDGVSGLVDKDRALRAKLLPRREARVPEPNAPEVLAPRSSRRPVEGR